MIRAAALNNAAWCAAVLRAHGLTYERAHGLWFCAARTPQYYPNVVTVDPSANPETQGEFIAELCRLHPEIAMSVKDSFACLDLSAARLAPLFDVGARHGWL